MDGVLVDSYRAHFESWRRLAQKHGMELTEEQFAATFGKTSRENIRSFWPGRVAEEEIALWDDQKEHFYREILQERFPEMDGASDLLRRLAAEDFLLAIGSSGPPENVELVRNRMPAGSLFSAAVTGKDVSRGKPEPDVFLLAARKLGLPPRRCAIVEDAPVGIEAGRRAGMVVIALTGTAPRKQLAGADFIISSLRQLAPETVAQLIDKEDQE
jgi:beta-phosphoglucomutase